jgi:hypothetical protein
MAKKALEELLTESNNADITLEQVEIITNPLRALKDGVKFIPTIAAGSQKISGILLSKEKIAEFLETVEST